MSLSGWLRLPQGPLKSNTMLGQYEIVIDGRAWRAVCGLGSAADCLSDEERRLLVQIIDSLPCGDETGPVTFEVEGPIECPLCLEIEKDLYGDLIVRLTNDGSGS